MNLKITQVTHRKSDWQFRVMDMAVAVELMKSDKTKAKVCQLRKKCADALPPLRRALAQRLPQLLFSGEHRKNKKDVFHGCVVLEIDGLKQHSKQEEMRQLLAAMPQTLLAMVDATDRKMLLVVRYCLPDGTLPTDDEEVQKFYAHAYRHALNTYEQHPQVNITPVEPTPAYLCPLTYDPNIYYNPNAVVVRIEQPQDFPIDLYDSRLKKLSPLVSGARNLREQHQYLSMQFEMALNQTIQEAAEEVAKLQIVGDEDLPPLRRLDFKAVVVRLARKCHGAGIEEEECTQRTITFFGAVMNEEDIRLTIHNVYLFEKGFNKTPISCIPLEQQEMLEDFMDRRYELRHNIMTGADEYRTKWSGDREFHTIDPRMFNTMVIQARKEGIDLWDKDVRRTVESKSTPNFSPLKDYLDNLPEWDGVDRLRALLRRIPTEDPRWVERGYCWFLSMVLHWQGGEKEYGNILTPLLIGEQGCGKSAFCKKIIPPHLQAYYTQNLDLGNRSECLTALTRYGLINLDEFDQYDRQQAFLKYLQQTPDAKNRKSHTSIFIQKERYASFIATTNHDDVLRDPTGSRRFIGVRITGKIDNDQPIEYDQLYAQAVEALKAGEPHFLNDEQQKQLMADNEGLRQRPLAEDLFYRYYRPAKENEECQKLTAGEIYHNIQKKSGIRLPEGKNNHFGRLLANSVRSMRHSNGRVYCVVEIKQEDSRSDSK